MESLGQATEAFARLAGTYALSHRADLSVGSKGGDYRNVVTNIDITISDMLKQEIAAQFPDDQFYSEEDPSSVDADVRTWAIDPIDGTSNYAREIPYYSSCVSVLKGGEVEAAAVFSPVMGECFVFHDGKAAFNGKEIRVGDVTELKQAYVNFHPGRKEEHRAWAGETKIKLLASAKKSMNLCSSALDLCYLAAGRVDVLIYGTLSTLDVAGAVAMVRAAGGEVYNYDTKEPIGYSPEAQRIIATANPQLLKDYFDKIT